MKHFCETCDREVTENIANFSKDRFNEIRCWSCQHPEEKEEYD